MRKPERTPGRAPGDPRRRGWPAAAGKVADDVRRQALREAKRSGGLAAAPGASTQHRAGPIGMVVVDAVAAVGDHQHQVLGARGDRRRAAWVPGRPGGVRCRRPSCRRPRPRTPTLPRSPVSSSTPTMERNFSAAPFSSIRISLAAWVPTPWAKRRAVELDCVVVDGPAGVRLTPTLLDGAKIKAIEPDRSGGSTARPRDTRPPGHMPYGPQNLARGSRGPAPFAAEVKSSVVLSVFAGGWKEKIRQRPRHFRPGPPRERSPF